MTTLRAVRRLALLGLVLALAACGGDSGGGASTAASSAGIVSADVLAFISLNTDVDGGQWEKADVFLTKLALRDELLAEVRKGFAEDGLEWERDVRPALGDAVDFVLLGPAAGSKEPGFALLVQPGDEAKFKALVAKAGEKEGPSVTRKLADGWYIVGSTEADIDRALAGDGPALDGVQAFEDATGKLSDETLVSAYVNGPAVQKLILEQVPQALSGSIPAGAQKLQQAVLSLEALDDGIKLFGAANAEGGLGQAAYDSAFVDEVPADSVLFVSFKGIGKQLGTSLGSAGPELQGVLGVTADDLAALLQGEVGIYVRESPLLPEVTLVAEVADEARAKRTLDTLATRAAGLGGEQKTTTVGGVEFGQVVFGGVPVSYAVSGGRLILTNFPGALATLKADGDKLSGSAAFKAAAETVGMGDETTGFVFVDFDRVLPVIQGLSGLAGDAVPPEALAGLRPLTTFLLFGTADGDEATVSGFLGVE